MEGGRKGGKEDGKIKAGGLRVEEESVFDVRNSGS